MATLPATGPAYDIKALIARHGFTNHVTKEVVAVLRASLEDVTQYLASPAAANLSAARKEELERLRAFTQARVSEAVAFGSKVATTNLEKYLKVELNASHLQGVAVTGVLGLPARSTMISAARLSDIVQKLDVGGVGFGDWWGKAATDIVGNTMRTVQIGLVQGKHPRDIVRDILPDVNAKAPSVLKRTNALVNTVIRTAVTGVQTEAALLEYREFKDAIKGVQLEAILDVRTSSICRALDGNIYALDDPALPRPPLHPNCRSVLVPVPNLAGTGIKGASAQGPKRVGYSDWLKQQPKNTVEQLLGKGQAKLFLDGKATLADLIGSSKQVLTVEQIEAQLASQQAMAAATTTNPLALTPATTTPGPLPSITLPPPPATPGAAALIDPADNLLGKALADLKKAQQYPLVANGTIPGDLLAQAAAELQKADTALGYAKSIATKGKSLPSVKTQVTKAKKLIANATDATSKVFSQIGKASYLPMNADVELLKTAMQFTPTAELTAPFNYAVRLADVAMAEGKKAGISTDLLVARLGELMSAGQQGNVPQWKARWEVLSKEALSVINQVAAKQGATPFKSYVDPQYKKFLQSKGVTYQPFKPLTPKAALPKVTPMPGAAAPKPVAPAPAVTMAKPLPTPPPAPPAPVGGPIAPMPPLGSLARYKEITSGTMFQPQSGSNPGGGYVGADGVKRYVKLYANKEQAYAETIAAQLYKDLNALAPDFEMMEGPNGKIAIASKWVDNAKKITLKPSATDAATVLDHFAADIFTANWDAVGLSGDNIMKLPDGRLYRVDTGGSFWFRAGGQLKSTVDKDFAAGRITEFDFFRSAKSQYSSVFTATGTDGEYFDISPQVAQIIDLRRKVGGNGRAGWEKYLESRMGTAWQSLDQPTRDKFVDFLHERETALKALSTVQRSKILNYMQNRGDDNAAAWLAANENKKPFERLDPLPAVGKPLPKPVFSPKLNQIADPDLSGANDSKHLQEEGRQNQSDTAKLKANPLSSAEFSAYRAYTGSSYRAINDPLRAGTPLSPQVKKWVKELDASLPRYTNDHDTTVLRGLGSYEPTVVQFNALAQSGGWPAVEKWLDNLVGGQIRDKGYMSTSYGKRTPRGFAADNQKPKNLPPTAAATKPGGAWPVFYRIKAKAGTLRGLSGRATQNGNVLSSHPSEMEWVIPRDTPFRVTGWSIGRYENSSAVGIIIDLEPW